MVTLHMEPRTPPMGWDRFCTTTEPYAIALDGYVNEGPKFQTSGPRANFNHHEGVSRLETRATCGQVLMAIRQGLFDCFRDHDGIRVHLYLNDCDEDVCVSFALLNNPHLAISAINPLLNRLVAMEDLLDATAGAYPFPKDLPALQELAWVFEPYRRFRLSGELDKKDSLAYICILHDVGYRILAHITGKGGNIPLDTRYERIGGGKGWAMIREIGAHGRTGAFSDGIRAYVSIRERPDGRITATLGRMSPFIPFPCARHVENLNAAERRLMTDEEIAMNDWWGTSDTVGGSPRVCGTRLSVSQIEAIINEGLA